MNQTGAAWVRLDGRAAGPALLGGKGAAADRLVALGFAVPASAVITTEAYRALVAASGVASLLERVRAAGAAGGAVPADEIDAAFLAAPMPDALAKEIVAAARAVGEPLAVRSSATVEDLAGTSFAGQYRSFLGVSGDEDVLRAVRLVWASLWHPSPCAYRLAHNVADDDIAMAVLLMAMVDAVRAGVAFSVDPGGDGTTLRVEAVEGLGEALVSGAVTPQAWSAPRLQTGRALDGAPPPVAEAAELSLAVERDLGLPQDIEWAWDGSRLWLVQARPITVSAVDGDGFDSPIDDSQLTTAGIAETLPGVLPPAVWQLASFCVEEALRRVLDDLGALGPEPCTAHGFIRRLQGRAALDLGALKDIARRLPGGSEEELEQQYFGDRAEALTAAPPHPSGRGWRAWVHDVRVVATRRRAIADADTVTIAAAEIAARRPDLDRWDIAGLLAYRRRLVDLGARAMAAELAVAASAVAAYRRLELMLTPHLGAYEAGRWARLVTAGVEWPMVAAASSMSVFAGPTWVEEGILPVQPPPTRREAGHEALGDLEAELRGLPRWRVTRILTGQVVDVRLHLLRRLVADAVAMLGRRERTKAAVFAVGGEVRRVHLALADRLVAEGRLGDRNDVDLLSAAELRNATRLPAPVELARRRRWLERYENDGLLPERFSGRPEPARIPLPDGNALHGAGASGGRFTGRARVVRSARGQELRTGEVLVAEATDAAWSPLFLRAGAIIVERGGPLSHAAIVAREIGVPAVLDVPGAANWLDGRLVTVDGDEGCVVVHDESVTVKP